MKNNKVNYGATKQFNGSFAEAEAAIGTALASQGFGILTEIDVQATLRKKLDIDYPAYKILGACNPKLAYKALQAEKEIGLLLPCNVIIYEEQGKVFTSIMKPTAALSLVKNARVSAIANQAEEKLTKVLNSI